MKHSQNSFSRLRLSIPILIIIIGVLFYYGIHSISPNMAKGLIKGGDPIENNSIISKISISTKDLSTRDESYVLIDPENNQILKSYNADVQRAPASTTKLLTGLIAIKTLQETDIVRVGNEVNVEGSQLGLNPGDEISVHELLTALYVHSSNDAAAALAVKISGSIPAFAEEMNKYVTALGGEYSHFTNPHGMPDSEHYTTANDLVKIASIFLKKEELMKFVKEPSARIQWKNSQGMVRYANVQNTNSLLGIYPGDEGLKTGTTTEAGQCLVSYVTRPDGELLLVLLGSKNRYNDTIKLLDEVWAAQRSKAALRALAKDPKSLIMSPGIF